MHRPKYDDWSLPKGKCDNEEDDVDCARREVEEETGLRVEVGAELPTTLYRDRFGRNKQVRYWAMQPVDGVFSPSDEVDEVKWLPLEDAMSALSYPRDREVLQALARSRR